MQRIRVGILRGGADPYYETSLQEGGNILSHLTENLSDKFKPVDILIDKNGVWHAGGIPVQPADLMHKVDVVWNAAHPSLSQNIQNLSIPIIRTNSFADTLSESKAMLEKHMKEIGVNMPRHIVLPTYQADIDGIKDLYLTKKAKEVFSKFSSPWIVKSFSPDSSMGVHVAKTFPELVDAISDGVEHNESILVEELIAGKPVSSHSVAGFRGKNIYTFPISGFSQEEKEEIMALSEDLYSHMGAAHYMKADFILNPNRGLFLKSISFSPDLSNDSDFCLACESVGAKAHHVLEHVLNNALLEAR